MPTAKTNRARVKYALEGSYGVAPAANLFRLLRMNSASLTAAPIFAQSDEIRSDRNRTLGLVVGKNIAGETTHDLLAYTYDELWQAALFQAWTRSPEIAIAAVGAGSGIYTASVAPGSLLVTGSLVATYGFALNLNNATRTDLTRRVFVVNGVASTSITTSNSESVVDTTGTMKVVGQQCIDSDLALTLEAGTGYAVLTLTSGNWPAHLTGTPGMWIYLGGNSAANQLAGANAAAHMGWYRIAPSGAGHTAKILKCDIKPSGYTATSVNSVGKTVRIYFGDFVRNGTTVYSLAMERSFMDINVHELFTGLMISGSTIELQPRSIARVAHNYIGFSNTHGTTEYATAPLAASDALPVSTAAHIGALSEGGAQQAVTSNARVYSATLRLTNSLAEEPAMGTASGIAGLIEGECGISGTLRARFGDTTFLDKLNNNTPAQFAAALRGARGGAHVFDVPYLSYSGGSPLVPGKNQMVPLEVPFDAGVHPSLGYAFAVTMADYVGL